ncbi:hypothetical protein BCR32DRAFT_287684 [Anaeromyces robustus]|uniref:Uncharacterized protein n=1 Tax=Anaeromyces robustus TaxID=1754192 RepID=A0A1Y1VR76_9FUNG|nr:hypothetical protein BCR32DRAFT_287684 [Anaeromyces robustus]|eukprot:ORX63536.1 hypothetical protein BCR32DRAFT_287684 [Anaeromyces robustus]
MRFNTELLLFSLIAVLLFGSSLAKLPGIGKQCVIQGKKVYGTECVMSKDACRKKGWIPYDRGTKLCEDGVCCGDPDKVKASVNTCKHKNKSE